MGRPEIYECNTRQSSITYLFMRMLVANRYPVWDGYVISVKRIRCAIDWTSKEKEIKKMTEIPTFPEHLIAGQKANQKKIRNLHIAWTVIALFCLVLGYIFGVNY